MRARVVDDVIVRKDGIYKIPEQRPDAFPGSRYATKGLVMIVSVQPRRGMLVWRWLGSSQEHECTWDGFCLFVQKGEIP